MGPKDIVRCAIHPAIGIARVGNSPKGHFIGPEVPGVAATSEGGFKDATGALKRQVARFRIFGFDGDGKVVKELTSDEAEITWTVHLMNKKAAWYRFEEAMDIPEATGAIRRRNPAYSGDNRKSLIIDPGERSIKGPCGKASFDTGKFLNTVVPLGEINTDEQGRLLVFGGFGKSASPLGKPLTGFNNEEWYDDISDGPVNAQVIIGERVLEVTPAWVIVAPPDYAPGVLSIVTLYDVVSDVTAGKETDKRPGKKKRKNLAKPYKVSFTKHIFPIFEKLCKLQWVNQEFHLDFGWGSHNDFINSMEVEKLASNKPEHKALRQSIFKKFRNPSFEKEEPDAWPLLYGDAFDLPPPVTPRKWLALTHQQYGWLSSWAEGYFESDWDPTQPPPKRLEDLPLNERPQALDKAALENCLGGPFHPGCEATWTMRQPLLYSAPFRINVRLPGEPEKDYGDVLTREVALAPNGPLSSNGPGDITRWLAVPWQADAAACGAGYQPNISPYSPTYWPARVPNHVLSEKNFTEAMNKDLHDFQRLKHFNLRSNWLRHLPVLSSFLERLTQFTTDWSKMGIIVPRSIDDAGTSILPKEIRVETENGFEPDPVEKTVNPWPWRRRQ